MPVHLILLVAEETPVALFFFTLCLGFPSLPPPISSPSLTFHSSLVYFLCCV